MAAKIAKTARKPGIRPYAPERPKRTPSRTARAPVMVIRQEDFGRFPTGHSFGGPTYSYFQGNDEIKFTQLSGSDLFISTIFTRAGLRIGQDGLRIDFKLNNNLTAGAVALQLGVASDLQVNAFDKHDMPLLNQGMGVAFPWPPNSDTSISESIPDTAYLILSTIGRESLLYNLTISYAKS
jgi:hypothetical protein